MRALLRTSKGKEEGGVSLRRKGGRESELEGWTNSVPLKVER